MIPPSLPLPTSHRTNTAVHNGSAPTQQWCCTSPNSNTITPTDEKFFKKQEQKIVVTCINTGNAESECLVAFLRTAVVKLWGPLVVPETQDARTRLCSQVASVLNFSIHLSTQNIQYIERPHARGSQFRPFSTVSRTTSCNHSSLTAAAGRIMSMKINTSGWLRVTK